MSSLPRRYRLARPDAGDYMPPNPRTIGALPFGEPQRARLGAWLSEAGWPRAHMEMAELEGYLVALITWPVAISSGAWLPVIWGERGWKVPNKISSRAQFEEFVALIIGFLQDLDRQLSLGQSQFEGSQAGRLWGRGFMTALSLGSQGLKSRSASAGAAVRVIAGATSSAAPLRSQEVEKVASAVFALMEQRASRGPLGPLAEVVPLGVAGNGERAGLPGGVNAPGFPRTLR